MTGPVARSSTMGAQSAVERLTGIAAEAGIDVAVTAVGTLLGRLALRADAAGPPRRVIMLADGLDVTERAAVLAFCIAALADERVQRRLRRGGDGLGVGRRPRRSTHPGIASLAQHMLRALGEPAATAFTLVDLPTPRTAADEQPTVPAER